ncbi:MAG: S8 family serine peptidase, partial [Natronosporangium sp.]
FRVAAVALGTVAGLGTGASPVAAEEVVPGGSAGVTRPELVDPRLQVELAAVPAGEPVDFLVALAAAPDVAALRFDRTAVVAALKATAEDSQRPVVDRLRASGAEVVQRFWLANQLLVRGPEQSVTAVTGLPGVAAVLPVAELSVPEPEVEPAGGVAPQTVEDRTWGVDRIGAHRVWEELGVDGTGVRVAVLDTGADITHPDLAGRMATDDPADPLYPGGWMQWDADGNPVESAPHDDHYHGTHVSGTTLGGDSFQDGTAIGVAPGASLMVGSALPRGSGTEPQLLAAMQWAVDPYDIDGDPAGAPAQVVNMSFGAVGAVEQSFAAAIRNMYFAGILPVTSAGNSGAGTHGTPGNVYEAFAIGATDDSDDVANFSSGAVVSASDYDQPPPEWPASWVVPDVSAPGVSVVSAVPPGTFEADPEAIYGRASGTSMASPHTAGAAALLLAADPSLTVDQLADLLIDPSFFDARYGQQRPNTRFGHGRIDAFQSVARVAQDTGIAGQLTDAATGEPVPAVDVTVVEAGVGMRTGPAGRYDLRLPPGTYTLELSWSGRLVTTVPDVVVAADALTQVDLALGGIAGQVTDAGTGNPVPDVTVEVAGAGVARTTGPDGRYRLYLAPGAYPLELSWSGELVAQAAEVVVEPAAVTDRDLVLGGVTGRVTDQASGDPLAGVGVAVSGTGLSART